MMSSTEDVEMLDVEDEEEDEDEVYSELDPDQGLFIRQCLASPLTSPLGTEASDDEEEEEDDELPPAFASGDRNSQLTVGYKGDRSYVVRGNNIGVFNHSVDNGVKYYATISKLATPQGKTFKPKHVGGYSGFMTRFEIHVSITYLLHRSCYMSKTPR